jgi:hypothetical protein
MSAAPTFGTLQKGRAWEYRVHRAAFLAGWYVRRSVNLRERVAGSPQTMAEVDILGLVFDTVLAPHLLVGECKDRKGGAKEADRVVWLLGLRQALKANHVLFAKTRLAEGTYTWARPFDVLLWEEASVRAIEQRFNLDPDIGYAGSFSIALGEGLAARKLPKPTPRLKAAIDYVGNAFWYGSGAARVKRVAAYFEIVGAAELDDEQRDLLVAEGLLALIAVALGTAGQLQKTSPARAKVWLHDALVAGVASAAALRDIAARADDYYRDAWVRSARDRTEEGRLAVPRLVDHIAQPPPWLTEFHELTMRLSERPQFAGDLLRFADLVLLEQLVQSGPVPAPLISSIAADVDELMRLLQLAGYFLRRVWGVEARLLERLLDNGVVTVAQMPKQMSLGGTNA